MKNLCKFVFVFGLLFCTLTFAQDYVNTNAESLISESKKPIKRYKVMCVTYSCCGVGIFGVEVWTHTECDYIDISGKSNFRILKLRNSDNTDFIEKEVELKDDLVLVDKDNSYEEQGLEQVMIAGKYLVINGEVAFEPVSRKIRIKKVCYVEEHSGSFFGHDYSFSNSICMYYPTFSKNSKMLNGGYAEIDLNSNIELLKKVAENNGTIAFEKDINFGEDYILKSGNYQVEDNGKI